MEINWDSFFNPKSIAIIGASTKPFKFGSLFLKALLDFKYPGKIYPVNPHGEKIQGLDSWSLENISDPIDLVFITVPAEQVPDEMRKCAKKNFKSIIILTAGFKETGGAGRRIEEECAKIAMENGMHVIGPNCFGVYHAKGGVASRRWLSEGIRGDCNVISEWGKLRQFCDVRTEQWIAIQHGNFLW
jgi:acyl-CoA synthetase (NDP forming)